MKLRDADVHEASYLPFLSLIPDEGSPEDQNNFRTKSVQTYNLGCGQFVVNSL
jgi:hypothetical protein